MEACRRTNFKFVVPASGVDSVIPLVQGIPAFDWVSAILVVRVHAVTSFVSSMKVNATNMSLSEDDPSIVFTDAAGTSGAFVTFSTTPVAQRVYVSQYVAPVGPMIQVWFSVSPVTGGGTIDLALSVDLIGRTA